LGFVGFAIAGGDNAGLLGQAGFVAGFLDTGETLLESQSVGLELGFVHLLLSWKVLALKGKRQLAAGLNLPTVMRANTPLL